MVGKPIDKSSPNIENRCCPTMACEKAKTECEKFLEDHNCGTKPICSDTGVLVKIPKNSIGTIIGNKIIGTPGGLKI